MPNITAIRALLGSEPDETEVQFLMRSMQRTEGKAGTELFQRGEHSDSMHLVVEGKLLVHVDTDGGRLELAELESGDWIGELQFIEPGQASATVTGTTDFVTLSIANSQLEKLIEECPKAASALVRRLLFEVADRLVSTSAGVVERVKSTEFRVAEIEERQGWFAEMVGRLFGGAKQ
jgi:CRP-like cAMP-binding protein